MAQDIEPPSGWHSIRPWNAQLSLYVREITSVSVTFILATDLSGEIDLDVALAALGFNAANDTTANEDGPADETSSTKPRSLITETLSKGLGVNVNNVNWQRVLIRVDEKADEAVIIIYGLMPGRQYDVDLALVQPGEGQQQVRRQVSTFEEHSDLDTASECTDPESPSYDYSISSSSDAHRTASTPSTSPSRTIPNTPPPPQSSSILSSSSVSKGSSSTSTDSGSAPQISLEERLKQLHDSLSLINAERENLLASLKSARKESQKADAALRSEMDALKRASEKHSAGEARSKQRILALQEAVKRAQAATKDTEAHVKSTESEVPALLKRKEAKESEYRKVKEEADKVRRVRETQVEKDRKRQEAMRTELQSLTNKLEKLTGKKEKHENTTIPDLESQLSAVGKDIVGQERLLTQMEMNREFEDVGRPSTNPFSLSPRYFSGFADHSNYVPAQRTRHRSLGATQSGSSSSSSIAGPGPISRPTAVAPIQRPSFPSSTSSLDLKSPSSATTSASSVFAQFQQMVPSSTSSSIWSPPPLSHTSTSGHSGRSTSLHYQPSVNVYKDAYYRKDVSVGSQQQQSPTSHNLLAHPPPPVILTNPARRGSLKSKISSSGSISKAGASTSSLVQASSTSSGSSSQGATGTSSTLSGRAPAFEPGKGRSFGLRISTAPAGGSAGAVGGKHNVGGGSHGVGVIGTGRR